MPAASWAQVRPACWRDALQLRLCLTVGWMDGSCLDPLRKAIARAATVISVPTNVHQFLTHRIGKHHGWESSATAQDHDDDDDDVVAVGAF